MKNTILGFAILLMTLGVTNLQAQDSTDYFPLHVGDFWRYKGDEQQWDAIKVVDTSIIDGKRYYVRQHPIPYTYYDTLGVDSLREVFQYVGNENWTLYKFNASVGDTWSYTYITPLDTQHVVIRLTAKLDSFTVGSGPLKGVYRNVLVFYNDIPGTYDAWSYDYLAPGLGLIYREWQLDRRILYGAIINGKLYGDTSTTDIKLTNIPIPTDFKLLQNYPNPFNPTTTIEYKLSERMFVDLSIYDLLGRKVKTLVRGFREPGTYEAKLEGGDLPSGIYLYRLEAGQTVLVRKAMLVK